MLKPCPFCGGDPEIDVAPDGVFCSNEDCELRLVYAGRDDWNYRPIEDALTARVEELEGALGKCTPVIEALYDYTKRDGKIFVTGIAALKALNAARAALSGGGKEGA